MGVFPGAFNPPTVGHEAIAASARAQFGLEQVMFLVPEVFPHKSYEGATFEDRIAMLCAATGPERAYSVASSDEGLLINIARQVRERYGNGVEICLICGRDAAERIVGWDYGDGTPLGDQLKEFRLLVASREGEYAPPAEYASRIQLVELASSFDEVSSTSVREAAAQGSVWHRWVSGPVAAEIDRRGLYQADE